MFTVNAKLLPPPPPTSESATLRTLPAAYPVPVNEILATVDIPVELALSVYKKPDPWKVPPPASPIWNSSMVMTIPVA